MTQPVIDTLRVSETLQQSGMAREQAEGVARILGNELGEHVAVQSDLDTGFQGVRSEMALMRSELEAGIGARIGEVRSELEAKIGDVRSDLKELNTKFNLGFGLLVAFLSVLVGIGLLNLDRTSAMSSRAAQVSLPAPAAASPTLPDTDSGSPTGD